MGDLGLKCPHVRKRCMIRCVKNGVASATNLRRREVQTADHLPLEHGLVR